jgi:hypothetical protein
MDVAVDQARVSVAAPRSTTWVDRSDDVANVRVGGGGRWLRPPLNK